MSESKIGAAELHIDEAKERGTPLTLKQLQARIDMRMTVFAELIEEAIQENDKFAVRSYKGKLKVLQQLRHRGMLINE